MKPVGNVEVIPATLQDETTYRNLFQFYLYEFSRFMGFITTNAGRFYEIDLDGCWTSANRYPFLIRADGNLAGLAMITQREKSRYTGEANVMDLQEFFIMAAFQKRGIGRQAAHEVFDMFPGRWEVFQLARNTNAQVFWRKVVAAYTKGVYLERMVNDGDYVGVVQSFDNLPRRSS
ncbi:MAG: hypothetical protein BroJett018_47530 [Chloroflexota bacterium]|nr:MAG: hypothetical protein BroJett018_47530 [Chloroflexota bacterium]